MAFNRMDPQTQPPADVMERLERAEHLKLSGKHVEALEILEDLLVEDPENIAALEEVADNELSLDRLDRAEAAAKEAIALDGESYTGHYILGFLASQHEQWTSALQHLRKANTLKSNNPEILRCLGWVLFHAGERAQGVVTLERALNLEDDNPLTLCDLGVTYLEIKNFTKARSLFQRSLDLDPKNARARECLDAIDRLERSVRELRDGKGDRITV
jgi:Flp pilus assembly protein TadD